MAQLKLTTVILVACSVLFLVNSCQKPVPPYETTFKKRIVEGMKIEPIIESIIIEATIDSAGTRQYFLREMDKATNELYNTRSTDFYKERLSSYTVFEQIVVKYRLSKDGPLIVERYRSDIFNGDTSFYELKNNRTIGDYVKAD